MPGLVPEAYTVSVAPCAAHAAALARSEPDGIGAKPGFWEDDIQETVDDRNPA